jgi:hypothetical protein
LKIASEFGNYFISEKIPVKTCEIFLAASVKKYMDLLLYTPLKRKKKKEKRKKKKEKRKQGATMVSIVYLHLRESCRGNWHRSVAVEQVAGIVAVY